MILPRSRKGLKIVASHTYNMATGHTDKFLVDWGGSFSINPFKSSFSIKFGLSLRALTQVNT